MTDPNCTASSQSATERIRSHGGGGYTRGCRCDVCKAAKARYVAADNARKRRLRKSSSDFRDKERAYRKLRTVRTFKRSPEAVARRRIRQVERRRAWTDEQRSAAIRRGNVAKTKINDRTRSTAYNYGKRWTGPEMEIASRKELSAQQVALMLGRTLEAVKVVRYKRLNWEKWW